MKTEQVWPGIAHLFMCSILSEKRVKEMFVGERERERGRERERLCE